MKTKMITLLLCFCCLLSACQKENQTKKENVFNPEAKLLISIPYKTNSPQNSIQSFADSISKDEARFLLDHGFDMLMTCYMDVDRGIDKEPSHSVFNLAIPAREDLYYKMRDTVNIKYIIDGVSVISLDYKDSLRLGVFPSSEDIILTTVRDSLGNLINLPKLRWEHLVNSQYDTIAYIPNSVMRNGKKQVNEALVRKDYNECYRIFNDFYKFIPITGKEYMELVRQGKN